MTADVCVVVPTIRDHECILEYAENAREHGFDTDRLFVLLVTEDFCDVAAMERTLNEAGLGGRVFDGSRRERWLADRGLGEFGDLIPAASHAQTSFGLLYLWAGDFEYGVFLDDDTRPRPGTDFFGGHLRNLERAGEYPRLRSDSRWVNVLHGSADDHGLYPRGYPYGATGETLRRDRTTVDRGAVVASQGLWTGVPDLDAVRILAEGDTEGQGRTRLSAGDYGEDFLVADGHYLTVCSMNLAFRREVVPAFYQLPMDDNPWEVGRFDDIWSGVFLKRACDVLGTEILSGTPLCRHEKVPRSSFGDLATEAPGLELNEHLWRIVDDAGADADTYAGVYAAMADALLDADVDYRNADFLEYVGEHMHEWLRCLAELRPGSVDAPGVRPAPAADD